MDTKFKPDAMKLNYSPEEFRDIVMSGKKPMVVPLYTTIPMPNLKPYEMFQTLYGREGFLLESMMGEPREASYSFLGGKPRAIINIGSTLSVDGEEDLVSLSGIKTDDPLQSLRDILSQFVSVKNPGQRFLGGCIGYCSYDLVYQLYPTVRPCRTETSDSPVIRVMIVTDGLVYDYKNESLLLYSSPVISDDTDSSVMYNAAYDAISLLYRSIITKTTGNTEKKHNVREVEEPVILEPQSESMSQDEYEDAVCKAREYIRAGDIFQVVLSRQVTYHFTGDPLILYEAVRRINPGPYMFYIGFPDQYIIGSSPEMLVRVEEKTITTVPIAGTRPRGKTKKEDDHFASDLLSDEKERSEHLMLVDLARNDIGRVSEFGSIMVDDFMKIEKFSHVQHIVSCVHGTLEEGYDCIDALKACFPAGTLSGAPKVRAMQIIDELEPICRGLYGGAVGYFGFDGNMDMAIAIRTVIAKDGLMILQTGAGIVADSVPSHEYEETEHKAKALITALQTVKGES